MRHDPNDGRLSLAEFLAWEAEARAAAELLMAQCSATGDAAGIERTRTFQAMIDRAVRVAMGQRPDDA